LNAQWADTLLAALRAAGADCVVASPGSRSTPLLCAAERQRIPIHMSIDERSAGFFAVGRAKCTGRPPILVCTSGSAGAHYYPAIIEAARSFVPVLALTADRPPELADCGAAQTVDQIRLYGAHARAYFDLGLPGHEAAALAGVARKAAQSVAASLGPNPGPVHLNVPARKPLEPSSDDRVDPTHARVTQHFGATLSPATDAAVALARACDRGQRGLIVAGPAPISAIEARSAIDALAVASGFPVWAEATSQQRFRGRSLPAHGCDALDHVAHELGPADVIIELWGTPTSAPYHRYVEAHPDAERWVVTPYGWRDAHSSAAGLVNADVGETARAVAAAVTSKADAAWTDSVLAANRRGLAIAEASADREDRIVRAAIAAIPAGALIAVGNSKPIRTLDKFVPGRDAEAPIWCQRGASGIDGLVSGAAGAASAGDRAVLLVLGDVSFAHDIGGLALARRSAAPLAILVIDNRGGRIFEQLPIAGCESMKSSFERLWLTPPDIDLQAAASTYGVTYATGSDPGAISRAVASGLSTPGCTLIRAEVCS
jgi:2-succinyl-5-enolpyruvyl-6-hydroxy-3-cyclohexene-1-carboxylate synthase